jgi:HPt (histidine-containing phosphotransfer) domain-containing protein
MQNASQKDPLIREIRSLYDVDSMVRRIKRAQHEVNLDDSEMREIVDQYMLDTPVMFENLKSAWQRHDYDEIVLYAHSLVGVTKLLNLNRLGEIARKIEEQAKKGERCDITQLARCYYHFEVSLEMLGALYPDA